MGKSVSSSVSAAAGGGGGGGGGERASMPAGSPPGGPGGGAFSVGSPAEVLPVPGTGTGGGGGGGGGGGELTPQRSSSDSRERRRERSGGGGEAAERVLSRVRWDPKFDETRDELTVGWRKVRTEEMRKSGEAAWSMRLQYDAMQTPFPQFVEEVHRRSGGGGGASAPGSGGRGGGNGGGGNGGGGDRSSRVGYHLVTSLSLRGQPLWSSEWGTDQIVPPPAELFNGGAAAAGADDGDEGGEDDDEEEGGTPELPEELWAIVLSSCVARELSAAAAVCRMLRGAAATPSLWRRAHEAIFRAPPDDAAPPAAVRARVRRSEIALAAWADETLREHDMDWCSGRGGQPLRALCFDGGGLLATAQQGSVKLWSTARRVKLSSLKMRGRDELHAAGVSCVHVDGRGERLLSGGGDGALHLFDLEDPQAPACSLRGHGAPITAACLLPLDSGLLAHAISASTDGAVKLWDGGGALLADLMLPAEARPAQPVPLATDAERASVVACGCLEQLVLFDLAAEVNDDSVTRRCPDPHPRPSHPRLSHPRPLTHAQHTPIHHTSHPAHTARPYTTSRPRLTRETPRTHTRLRGGLHVRVPSQTHPRRS